MIGTHSKTPSTRFLGLEPDSKRLVLKFIFLASIPTLGMAFIASTIGNDLYEYLIRFSFLFEGWLNVFYVTVIMFSRMLIGSVVATIIGFYWLRWFKDSLQSSTLIRLSIILFAHLAMVAIYGGGIFGGFLVKAIYANAGSELFYLFELTMIANGIVFFIMPVWLVWLLIYWLYCILWKTKNRDVDL